MNNKGFIKGIIVGVLIGLMIPASVLATMMFFNIGNVGNLIQANHILTHDSWNPLSLSERSEGAITGMVDQLNDPYSYYLNSEDYKDMMEEVNGTYEGVGVYLATAPDADYTVVIAPIKGTPAFEAGLLAGDEILQINGEDMAGKCADEISTMIKHGEKTHFVFDVRRGTEILTFEMDRQVIDIPSVDYRFLEGQNGLAYISISSFAANTFAEVQEAISSLEEQGEIRGILLDLRNNPGGSVTSVLDVADMFLAEGEHILWVESKNGEECYDSENADPCSYPLVVLVNENSASASEILSGALQDNKRATLVGTTTFGKGIIQTVFPLDDGVAVKVTTAEYLSPDKHKIHEIGITPDIKTELGSDDFTLIYSLDPSVDPQLKKGIETLLKKIK